MSQAKHLTLNFDLPDSLALLERMPSVLDALLRGTSDAWHSFHEAPATWSPFEVVGHLIHAEETDWIPRARLILEHGEDRPFEPFDRFAQLTRFAGSPLDSLLDKFAEARRESLAVVRGWQLTEAQLDRTGRHPALGAVTLRQLLATWTVHDLNHLAQISRVLAKRYTDDVGPWREYLSILNRP